MSLTKLITAAALATVLTLVVMPSVALAQTMEQEQKLDTNTSVKVTCNGAYNQNCTAEATANAHGEQKQKLVYRADGTPVVIKDKRLVCREDNVCFYEHNVVDTGLDFNMLAGVAGTLVTGAAATVVKIKNRVA